MDREEEQEDRYTRAQAPVKPSTTCHRSCNTERNGKDLVHRMPWEDTTLSANGVDVVNDEALVIRAPVVDSMPVVVRLPRAELVTPLPEGVGAHAIGRPGRSLPGSLDAAVVRRVAVCPPQGPCQ